MSTKLPTMSLDSEITSGHDWKEIGKIKYEGNWKFVRLIFELSEYFDSKIIKRFKINDVVSLEPEASIDEDLRKIIKGEGLGNLTLIVDFEIEFDGKKYILTAEMQDTCDFIDKGHWDSIVRYIYKTRESEKLVNDIVEKFDFYHEYDEESIAYLSGRLFSEFPQFHDPLDDEGIYDLLDTLISEMEDVTNKDVFNTLRERVQKKVRAIG